MNFKEKCNKATELIESCWDENNPVDGLSFDERLNKKLEEDPELKNFFNGNKIGE